MRTERVQVVWSDVYYHHDPSDPLTVYDAAGKAWRRPTDAAAGRYTLVEQDADSGRGWTPGPDDPVWIDPPPIPEPPDGTRIEFEHNTDVYGAWRDDADSARAGYRPDEGWCLFGSTVSRSWAVMWLEFGQSLATAVRLVPHPDDTGNYAKWPTAQYAAAAKEAKS